MRNGAIIGFGQVAEKAHAPAWASREDVSIRGIAESDPARRRAAAARFPAARLYETLESLLEDQPALDFVDIATPPFLHSAQVLDSLRSRCHVLCEKPLALDSESLARIREASLSMDRTVFTAHNWKHAPILREAVRLVRTGAIGTLRRLEFHVLRDRPAPSAGPSWRMDRSLAGGGILIDHGWHQFYLLQQFLPDAPGRVCARLTRPGPEAAEEEALCLLETPQASASIYLSWRAPLRSNRAVLHGSAGILECRDDHLRLERRDSPTRRVDFPEKLSRGSAHPEWFQDMLGEFTEEMDEPLRRGRNLVEAQVCLSIIAASYRSQASDGGWISLPPPVPA